MGQGKPLACSGNHRQVPSALSTWSCFSFKEMIQDTWYRMEHGGEVHSSGFLCHAKGRHVVISKIHATLPSFDLTTTSSSTILATVQYSLCSGASEPLCTKELRTWSVSASCSYFCILGWPPSKRVGQVQHVEWGNHLQGRQVCGLS